MRFLVVFLLILLHATVESRGGRSGGGRGKSAARATSSSRWPSSKSTSLFGFRSRSRHGLSPRFRGGGSSFSRSPTISRGRLNSFIFADRSMFSGAAAGLAAGAAAGYLIARPDRPFRVENIDYYWDANFVPVNETCQNSTDEVGNKQETECVLRRCTRALSELDDERTANLTFPASVEWANRPYHIAWRCPSGQGCCEWECCEMVEDRNWLALFAFLTMVVLIGCYLLWRYIVCCRDTMKRKHEHVSLLPGSK